MSINIDVGKVISSANNIALNNKSIYNEFQEIEKAINILNMHWESQASERVIHTFNDIKNSFHVGRNAVVENYVGFLLYQVGEFYDKTESVIVSAASEFK